MKNTAFSPGFRFSTLDACVLVIAAVATVVFIRFDRWIGLAVAFVVLHFFLFCNILRMSRPFELLWAGVFALLTILATMTWITWPVAFGLALFTTLLVAALEMRRPSYHGVAWRRVNPQLPQWWQARANAGDDHTPRS